MKTQKSLRRKSVTVSKSRWAAYATAGAATALAGAGAAEANIMYSGPVNQFFGPLPPPGQNIYQHFALTGGVSLDFFLGAHSTIPGYGGALFRFTLNDYAFGDPGQRVKTGQTTVPESGGSLGLLAWRARRSSAAAVAA